LLSTETVLVDIGELHIHNPTLGMASDDSRKLRHAAYKTVATELRAAILAGEFPPGRPLPTEARLATDYGVSRQTVRQAFSELVHESLVYRVPGRGSFARGGISPGAFLRSLGTVDDLIALSLDTELEIVVPPQPRADVAAASRLRLESDTVMMSTVRRVHEEVPFAVTNVFLPLELGRILAAHPALQAVGAKSAMTIIGLIDESPWGPIAGAQQSITVATVPSDLAPLIDCVAGTPVLRVDRLYFGADGKRLELAINHFNPTRYSYRLELRRTLA
jgi:GntR family transcriptional regulator